MYASHNSLTGYKPKHWWGWFLLPFARCQRTNIWQQMENGARVFDLRVRFDRHGGLVPCHGLVEFNADVQAVVSRLEASGCYYRVVLENRLGGHRVKADDLDRLKAMFLTPRTPALSLCERQEGLEHHLQPAWAGAIEREEPAWRHGLCDSPPVVVAVPEISLSTFFELEM